VPQRPRQAIAVPGGTGLGIGGPSGGQDHRWGFKKTPSGPDPLNRSVPNLNFFHRVLFVYPDLALLPVTKESGNQVQCPIRDRENPLAPFHGQRDPQSLKKVHQVLIEKSGETIAQEFSIRRIALDEGLDICLVGQVAPSFPGEAQL